MGGVKVNLQEIKDFLKSIKNTDIEEMQYQSGDSSLYFKKTDVEPVIPITKESALEKEEEKKQTFIAVKSTMVGTFSFAQSSDGTLFAKDGDVITVGQKIGQIEAMKIIKDVNSEIKGKIVEVFISNGQSVEYGQKLFLVDTSK
ncbi:acetyl-CoA carboxylase biotin carboxyl carrier protein subunit [Endomicrobiia bacterium]|nr:acetyl-CoA carboxylase biotin carboxyl carrier protein subunit [Endomicrobiia bacterium]GHT76804.1 acetyl-CoA carboxylase biotin carboxyl carrier protein subunit [Endomicrobiia bacterium]